MAGLKIIWSEEAVQCFHQISSFYCSQAGNSAYVRKLLQMITGTLRLVPSYPYMYRAASAPDTRVFVCEYFSIYYSVLCKLEFSGKPNCSFRLYFSGVNF